MARYPPRGVHPPGKVVVAPQRVFVSGVQRGFERCEGGGPLGIGEDRGGEGGEVGKERAFGGAERDGGRGGRLAVREVLELRRAVRIPLGIRVGSGRRLRQCQCMDRARQLAARVALTAASAAHSADSETRGRTHGVPYRNDWCVLLAKGLTILECVRECE